MSRRVSRHGDGRAEVIGKIVFRLKHAYAVELTTRQAVFQLLPKNDTQVFDCWDDATEEIDVKVEVFVVDFIEYDLLEQSLELLEINDVARFRIRKPLNGNLYYVVVAMTPKIVAFVKYGFVAIV